MNADQLNEHLSTDIKDMNGLVIKDVAKRIKCADGASLSVQASAMHYCLPRTNEGPYLEVEVGFPSVDPGESWSNLFEGDWETEDRTSSVYGYVPISLVLEFINEHGGALVEEG